MKTILITGGTDGLGKDLARKLSFKHNVIITSRSNTRLKKIKEEIKCEGVVMDVTDFYSIKKGIRSIITKHNKIDCLVNNAGLWIEGEIEKNSVKEIKKILETNLLGVILMSKAVIPFMKKRRSGTIININSQNGLYAKTERSVYTASKWGITGLTKSLQSELSKFNIFVTGLYPGKINTDFFNKAGIKKNMGDAINTEDLVDVVEFILSRPKNVHITELSIKSILH